MKFIKLLKLYYYQSNNYIVYYNIYFLWQMSICQFLYYIDIDKHPHNI